MPALREFLGKSPAFSLFGHSSGGRGFYPGELFGIVASLFGHSSGGRGFYPGELFGIVAITAFFSLPTTRCFKVKNTTAWLLWVV